MERKYVESIFFLILLFGTLGLVLYMILPYLNTIILSAILAFLFSGVFERLVKTVGNRSIAALLTTLLVLVTVLLPLSLAGYQIAQEAAGLYTYVRDQTSATQIADLVHQAQIFVHKIFPQVTLQSQDVTAYLEQGLAWVIGRIGPVFAGTIRLIISFVFVLFFFYYLVRDGKHLRRQLMDITPLSDAHENAILDRIALSIASTVRGQLVIALLQALVAGVGFTLFGLPNPALWAAVLMIASFVPTIGTALIQTPVVIYLALSGHPDAAIGAALWATFAVGLLDNFLGPRLMAAGSHLHPLIMLLAVLGGIALFGPMGILMGPILVSLLAALLDIYRSLMSDSLVQDVKKAKRTAKATV